jgi:hypothetical protein
MRLKRNALMSFSTVMQYTLSEKAKAALAKRDGAKKILTELVNLNPKDDPGNIAAAETFLTRYGPLDPRSSDPEFDVLRWAEFFRTAWKVKTPEEIEGISRHLENIFKAEVTLTNLYERPAIVADFATGTWRPQPRYLLDHLGLQLMESRRMLHCCERPECQRFFIKTSSRDKYCTLLRQWERELDRVGSCGEVMRRRGQYRSVENNREAINARRREPKTSRKRRTT